MLIETLKRHWWVPVLRGIAAVVFGVMAFVYPGLTVAVLVLLFGAWVLVDGIFRVVGALAIVVQTRSGDLILSSESSELSSDFLRSMRPE